MKISVEQYVDSADPKWRTILMTLIKICRESELIETVKWGMPVYTFGNKNVVGIGAFNSYVGLWFFNGALLKDPKKVLVNAQEGKTKAMRHWRFDPDQDIPKDWVVAYLQEAIENQKKGKEIGGQQKKEWPIPYIFQQSMENTPQLRKMFDNLTPGRQREYLEYLNEPKLEKTVFSRLEKCIPLILAGKGLNDKYK